MTPQSECLHVRKLDLCCHLQWLQVKLANVETLVGLHHVVRHAGADQPLQPTTIHVGIQFDGLPKKLPAMQVSVVTTENLLTRDFCC